MAGEPPKIEFYRGANGRMLAARVFGDSSERPPIVFLHGITSHSGWYGASCRYLADHGYQVHFIDRRGSGLNQDERGDIDGCRTWILDVLGYLQNSCAGRPVVLCGISWGAKLAAAVAREAMPAPLGLALIAPGLYSMHEPGVLSRGVLRLPAAAWLERRRLNIPLRDPALFTDTPASREFIQNDPLALRQVTWRFAQSDGELTNQARAALESSTLPVLLMLPGRDRIVDRGRTKKLFELIPSPTKSLREYPNAAHTLEFEPDPSDYFADLLGWISETARHLREVSRDAEPQPA